MRRFPAEFKDLLTAGGQRVLRRNEALPQFSSRRQTPIAVLPNVISAECTKKCIRLLDETMYPILRPSRYGIPSDSITGMTENYEEKLAKTMRLKTALFSDGASRASRQARSIGLQDTLGSASFRAFVEAVTGYSLGPKCGTQVICYESGDYSGPHNDHHPEDENLRDGYIDAHIMFSNDSVATQWLVYERKGHFSEATDVSGPSAVAIYRLPFWHYTTPLIPRHRKEATARRWLLLASFELGG
jgi:hypothetical protein